MTLRADRVLLAACVLVAWLIARRPRTLAVTLSALLALDLVGVLCAATLHGPRPYTGWMRAAFHGQQAVMLGWSAVIACGVVAVLRDAGSQRDGRRPLGRIVRQNAARLVSMQVEPRSPVKVDERDPGPVGRFDVASESDLGRVGVARDDDVLHGDSFRPGDHPSRVTRIRLLLRSPAVKVAAAYLAAWLTCAALYPWLRGDSLFAVYRASRITCVVIVGAAPVTRARWPTWAEAPALLLAAGHAAQLFGAWFAGTPARDWPLANLCSTLTYSAVLAAMGGTWIHARKARESSC